MKLSECYPGKRVGKLVLLFEVRKPDKYTKSGVSHWYCKCDCGRYKEIKTGSLGKHTNSCGCSYKEKIKSPEEKSDKTTGSTYHKLYQVWKGILDRCYNSEHKFYCDYGGRGIKMCSEWKHDYYKFKEWAISSGYKPGAKRGSQTIDRINVNGNYEPDNCRWVNQKTQMNNRRINVCQVVNGEKLTLSTIAEKYNIPVATIFGRYNKGYRGNSLLKEYNVGEPGYIYKSDKLKKKHEVYAYLVSLSNEYNIPLSTLRNRYHKAGLRGKDLVTPKIK